MFSNLKNFFKNHPNFTAFLIFVAVVFSLYGKTLFYDWQYMDDDVLILDKQDYLTFSNMKNIFTDSFFGVPGDASYRPLLNTSFLIDRTFYGTDPFGYHITNIIIFLLSIFAIYLLFSYKNDKVWSAVFCIIIAVHPMLGAIVSRVVDRSESLLVLFSVLSFYFLWKYTEEENKKNINLFLHTIFFLAVLFIKEVSVVLPVIFFVFYVFYTKKNKRNIPLFFIWFLCLFFFFLCRKYALRESLTGQADFMITAIVSIKNYFYVLFKYFYNVFFPITKKLSLGNEILFFVLSLLVYICIFVKTKYKNIKLILFAFMSFILLFLPTIITNNEMQIYVWNRLFLPMIFFFYILLENFQNYDIKSAPVICLLFAVIFSFSCITYFKIDMFQNKYTAYLTMLAETPSSPYLNAKFGTILAETGLYDQAEERLLTAIKYEPYNYNHYNNLAVIYIKTGRLKDAEKYLIFANKLNPYDENTNYNLKALKNYLEKENDK